LKGIGTIGIRGRITLFYLTLLLLSLGVSGVFYQRIYSAVIQEKVSSASLETLESVSSNVRSLFLLANNYSKLVVANPTVRDLLKSRKGYENVLGMQQVSMFMESIMSSFVEVSSIYIVDNGENRFFKDKYKGHFLSFNSSRQSQWWSRAAKEKGGSYLILNGGDAFSTAVSENFISHIRVINDIDNQSPIGAVIINISESLFEKAVADISKHYDTEILILDERNNNIFMDKEISSYNIEDLLEEAGENKTRTMHQKNEGKLYTYLSMDDYGWKIISIIPYVEVTRESRIFLLVSSLVLIVISILIFVGSVLITRMFTRPVNHLVDVMADVGKGRFHRADFQTPIDEFNRLRDGYNYMIEEIESLLDRAVREEKTKRRVEMKALQAQIKPHFLYNTFDSISSLALLGRTQEVYKMVTALGNYYRTSLSKGKEIISLEEEVEMVRNYLEILKVRYGDLFSVSIEIDPELLNTKVLKLMLQPFIENALYHGIKPKGEPGEICITAHREGDRIKIEVIDDGIGMGEEQIAQLTGSFESASTSHGFGLRGTVKRLQLYYGCNDIFSLISEKAKGTVVTLKIPGDGYCDEKK